MKWRRRLRAVRLAFFAVFTLGPAVWALLHVSVPWFAWLAAAVAVSYTGALRMIVQRGWVSDVDTYRCTRRPGHKLAIAALGALPLALIWPCVWVALAEAPQTRRSRQEAERAEFAEREAKSLRERERALGLGG